MEPRLEAIRWSENAHFVANPHQSGQTAVIDSLYLKPVYLDWPFSELEARHRAGAPAGDSLVELEAKFGSVVDMSPLVEALRDARILVDDVIDTIAKVEELAAAVEADRHLTELYLVLTGGCNFSCPHCLSGSNSSELPFFKSTMDFETASLAVSVFANALSVSEDNRVVFYGGEPLLRWPLMQDVMSVVRRQPMFGRGPGKVHCKVITNGSLLNERVARELADNMVDVVLSFDGPTWLTKQSRPAGPNANYPTPESLIPLLTRVGVRVSLSVTLTENTLANLDELLSWVADDVSVPVVLCIVKQTKDHIYTDAFAEQSSDAVLEAYRRILEAGGNEERLDAILESIRLHVPYVQDCYAQGANQIVVEPNGRVGVCQGFLSDNAFFFSNIRETATPADLFNSSAMRSWQRRLTISDEGCRQCASLGVCGGGCPTSASRVGGTIYSIDKGHCAQSKKLLPWLLWDVIRDRHYRAKCMLPDYAHFGLPEDTIS